MNAHLSAAHCSSGGDALITQQEGIAVGIFTLLFLSSLLGWILFRNVGTVLFQVVKEPSEGGNLK